MCDRNPRQRGAANIDWVPHARRAARAMLGVLLLAALAACDDCGFLIATNTLPDGVVGRPYNSLLVVHCGGGDEWTVVGGTLPPGVVLRSDGSLVGVPTTAGTFDFTVAALDLDSGEQSQRGLTIVVLGSS